MDCSSEYLILLTIDMEGLVSGIDKLEEIISQTFKDYFDRKKFDEFIKIPPFKMTDCVKSS